MFPSSLAEKVWQTLRFKIKTTFLRRHLSIFEESTKWLQTLSRCGLDEKWISCPRTAAKHFTTESSREIESEAENFFLLAKVKTEKNNRQIRIIIRNLLAVFFSRPRRRKIIFCLLISKAGDVRRKNISMKIYSRILLPKKSRMIGLEKKFFSALLIK